MKDEPDVGADTCRHMVSEGSEVLVLDNLSQPDFRRQLEAVEGVTVFSDLEPGYYQARKMNDLAKVAAEDFGADWIVPFDADELWTAPGRPLADWLERAGDVDVVTAGLLNHVVTALDASEGSPFETMTYRLEEPNPLDKVAFRPGAGALTQGNHSLISEHQPTVASGPTIRHFQMRSAEQFVRKAINGAAAYKAAPDLPANMGRHWREYGEIYERDGETGLEAIFTEHWFYLSLVGLVEDPAPFRRWG